MLPFLSPGYEANLYWGQVTQALSTSTLSLSEVVGIFELKVVIMESDHDLSM